MNRLYQDYLKSDDWLTKKYLKKLRTNKCAICNSLENLDVHHLNYRGLVDVELSDLRVLCRHCHFMAHELHKAGKIKFTSTNHHSRFALIKNAVKKELGITHRNMFN
jgi:5-methylcytosine-specific restriction endonuclease McrA